MAHTADSALKDDMGGLTQEEYENMDQEARDKLMEAKISSMQEESEFKKAKRQVKCAKFLRERVRKFEDIDKENPLSKAEIESFLDAVHEEGG